jgi:hypothetical protein
MKFFTLVVLLAIVSRWTTPSSVALLGDEAVKE